MPALAHGPTQQRGFPLAICEKHLGSPAASHELVAPDCLPCGAIHPAAVLARHLPRGPMNKCATPPRPQGDRHRSLELPQGAVAVCLRVKSALQ